MKISHSLSVITLCAAMAVPSVGFAGAEPPAVPLAAAQVAPTAETAEQRSPRPLAEKATQDYERRERAAKPLESFQGGEGAGIYVGGSTLAVVLLVVILILIL